MTETVDHLQMAKEHLVVAESGDAKREAYRQAAEHIAAAKQADPKLTNRVVATTLGKSGEFVQKVLQWRSSGYQADTPWLMDEKATGRAALSHTKATLRDAPLEQIERIVQELPPAAIVKIVQAGLEKPEIAHEIAKSADASAAVIRASGRVTEEAVHQNRKRTRAARGEGSVGGGLEFLVEVLGNAISAKGRLNDSYKAARDHDINDDQKETLEEVFGEINTIIDWYRSYLASGDQSFEDELTKLLS